MAKRADKTIRTHGTWMKIKNPADNQVREYGFLYRRFPFLGGFQSLKAGASPNTRSIRIAPHSKGPQRTGLNLTPSHLRLIPSAAVNALLTDGSEGRSPAR